MSASARRIRANRRNAALSTGPTTEAGKEASKNNAFKHGLTSQQIVIKNEDPQAFEQLNADTFAEFAPVGLAEEMLASELAIAWWRLLRVRAAETKFFASMGPGADPYLFTGIEARVFAVIQRYVVTAERTWRRALKELQQTQARRKQAAPAPAEIGSVSQNPTARPSPAATAERPIGFVPQTAPNAPNSAPSASLQMPANPPSGQSML
ncbi:MAG: hypothetical protein ABI165_06710 [Bryobacteraceae bacterium]